MADAVFIGYKKCSTSRKAENWLAEQGIDYTWRDITTENPTAEELREWHKASGLPIRRLFNTSGRLYREGGVKLKLDAGLSDDEAYALLAQDGMLVKRPIAVGEGFVLFGFRQPEWEAAFLGR